MPMTVPSLDANIRVSRIWGMFYAIGPREARLSRSAPTRWPVNAQRCAAVWTGARTFEGGGVTG